MREKNNQDARNLPRKQKFMIHILENEPSYRQRQITEALFDPKNTGWEDITVLPKELRGKLKKEVPWFSFYLQELKISKIDGSKKAVLKLCDNNLIESVLIKNARGEWTLCLSTQVGCPIGCVFCSTGKMGFRRNLTKEEIIDQFRFWMREGNITNIVVMGMGEPLLNYENVRDGLKDIIEYANIGQNHIVLSTVGAIERLWFLLDDPLWPNVRVAISLHSVNNAIRKKIIPAHNDSFFEEIIKWAKKYQEKLAAKNRCLNFEYILIKDLNDGDNSLKELLYFLSRIGKAKVNLIPYNYSAGNFMPATRSREEEFQNKIKSAGFTCTIRKSYGADISGACGQLITAEN
ncbi:MAG: 23S rRNA (adenine(2503)-C(2))-methyltransferase RlmN [bacterium]